MASCWLLLLVLVLQHLVHAFHHTPALLPLHLSRSTIITRTTFYAAKCPPTPTADCDILGDVIETGDEVERFNTLLVDNSKSVASTSPLPLQEEGEREGGDDPAAQKIINISEAAVAQLKYLQTKQALKNDADEQTILRMAVKRGGCSGLSYDLKFST
jgi:hypothetical protein